MNTLLSQASFVLDSCGKPVNSATGYVDIPSHIIYTRFLASDGTTGSEDIGGVMHRGGKGVSFFLRAMTAQILPQFATDGFWRLRFANGKYFQSALTGHAMAFGFGSNRQVFVGTDEGVEWKPGDKMFVDLSTTVGGVPAAPGISITIMFEGVYRFPVTGLPGAAAANVGNMPRYFQKEPQNILAPEFSFAPPCPSETPAGYQDEEYWYQTPNAAIVVGAGGGSNTVSNVALQIEPQWDFVLRGIWSSLPSSSTAQVTVRLRRGDGFAMCDKFIPILAIQGPVFKELIIKGGDTFNFDAQRTDTNAGTVNFSLLLYGVRRRKATS